MEKGPDYMNTSIRNSRTTEDYPNLLNHLIDVRRFRNDSKTDKNKLKAYFVRLLDIENDEDTFDDAEYYNAYPEYRIMCDLLISRRPLLIITENRYVDRFYRDSYYLYFAGKHTTYKRFCKRVSFFSGDSVIDIDDFFAESNHQILQESFMGSMVIRPLHVGKIGRTLLNPRFFAQSSQNEYIRLAKYKIGVAGLCLDVDAFPYSMQDGQTATCAETTILNLMDYFSRRYPDYKLALPSDIFAKVDQTGYERALPSTGMTYYDISRVISDMGFFPRLFGKDMFTEADQLRKTMHYYLESGIPVALGIKKKTNIEISSAERDRLARDVFGDHALHSIICVGHGEINKSKKCSSRIATNDKTVNGDLWITDTADLCDSYIVMDDGKEPYKNVKWTKKGKDLCLDEDTLTTVLVPLYRRMFLVAEDALQICRECLENTRVFHNFPGLRGFENSVALGSQENPLITRLFLASGRHFREERLHYFAKEDDESLMFYAAESLPRYIWCCELYTREGYQNPHPKAIGEIILDATASKDDFNKVLLFHYYNYIEFLSDNSTDDAKGKQERENVFLNKSGLIKAYSHNLTHIEPFNDVDKGQERRV